jgi:3-dehydroquinate synthase
MQTIKLQLPGGEAYSILLGYDVRERIGKLLAGLGIAQRYVVVTDANVAALYGRLLIEELTGFGLGVEMIACPAGEASKNIDTALSIVRQLVKAGADRKTALVALGGGVVGDVTGLVASLYMRSIPYLQIPTTLVAQVDSSIGGKTAIDLPEAKNLLGTFYHPRVVLTDPAFLTTLPAEEFINGLAEVVKYGIIDQGNLFTLLEDEIAALKQMNRDVLLRVIERCCVIKKLFVEVDEKDQGPRRFLNFGHTLGHALEAASNYKLAHGAGVSLGMMAAARLSTEVGGLSNRDRERIEHLIIKAGLPTTIPGRISTDLIISKLTADKKKSGPTINFVLLRGIGAPFVTGEVGETMLRSTIEGLKG